MSDKLEALEKQIEELRTKSEESPLKTQAKSAQIKTVKLILKNRKTLRGHYGKIYSLHWSNQTNIVSASQDGKLIIWDAFTTNKQHAIPLRSSWVMTCAFSPSGDCVASGGLDNTCSIYKLDQSHLNKDNSKCHYIELIKHEGYLSCCRFISNSEIITSSGDSTSILWDIEKKVPITTFTGHLNDVMSVSISKSKHIFASGSCDSTVKIFDFRAGPNCILTFGGHESDINSVDFLPSANSVGTGSDDSSCRLFDLRSAREVNRYCDDKILCGITSVVSSKTGRFLFAGYDNYSCNGWDTLTGEISTTLLGHENRISCIGLSNDGSALATGSWDTLVNIWA